MNGTTPGGRQGGPAHAPRIPFALLVTGLIVGGMCALLLLNTASAANELRRHDLAVADTSVAAQVQQLQNQVAASAAPGALGSAAAALGMVPAGNPAFLQVGANGSVRLLGSPAAATAAAPPAVLTVPATTHSVASMTKKTVKGAATSTKSRPASPAHATPTPSSTPTPTTTLPGGTR